MSRQNRITFWPVWGLLACLLARGVGAAEGSPPGGDNRDVAATSAGHAVPQAAGPAEPTPSRAALVWAEPETLLAELDALATHRVVGDWAAATARSVRRLGVAAGQGSPEAETILRQLDASGATADALAAALDDSALAREVSRAGYALRRRLDVWQPYVEAGARGLTTLEAPSPDPQRLSRCLAQIDRATTGSAKGQAWREYLAVDALRQWTAEDDARREPLPRALAQRVLRRLTEVPLSSQQQEFVASGPVAALCEELRCCVVEPADLGQLLGHVEQYERTGLDSDARLLAADCARLRLTSGEAGRQLAEQLDAHYRNANVRVAVTGELLNRLLPEQEPEVALVRDTVLGRPVSGRSLTSTELGVRLLPDPNRVRLALEVTGEVASLTSTSAGPATFHNDSTSTYTAQKPLEIDLKGIRILPTEVSVDSDTRIRELQTAFDGVPLLGGLVRQIARSQHEQKRGEASAEVREKIASQARQRIDEATTAQLTEVCRNVQQRVLGPLETSRLDPTLIGAETTDERLTIRLRLAGEDQLGSHTPRPQAPGDSLASLQVHETALNNLLARLELDGRTFTLPELADHVAARLGRSDLIEVAPDQRDVRITFAERDAVGVGLEDGRLMIRLAIARLSKSPLGWHDFVVRVFYEPRIEGRSAGLGRDGVIQLSGQRLATREQIALRGIFAKTFSQRRVWQLTPDRLADDAEFDDLAVTQFEIADGWLGVALGPQRGVEIRTARSPR